MHAGEDVLHELEVCCWAAQRTRPPEEVEIRELREAIQAVLAMLDALEEKA